MNEPLPRFARPPVIETGLVVRFDPVAEFSVARLGVICHSFRDRFPTIQQALPVEVPIERIGLPKGDSVSFQFGVTLPLPRMWLVNQANDELLQIQTDLFGRNWRKLGPDQCYPHYTETLRPSFQHDYDQFLAFFRAEGLPEPRPIQCEAVYVNHIFPGPNWSSHSEFSRVFRLSDSAYRAVEGLAVEELSATMRHVFLHSNGAFAGRLHAVIEPAIRTPDQRPLFVLTLTARGAPATPDREGVFAFFDRGRELIVRTFASITTEEMHKEWGRTQ